MFLLYGSLINVLNNHDRTIFTKIILIMIFVIIEQPYINMCVCVCVY